MKKVLVLVAVMLSVCLGLAAVAGAVSTFVADGEAKILKTVTDGETIAEYFTTASVKGTSQGWGDAVEPTAVENVEVDGERFLKITLDNQNFNFRLTLDSDPAPETLANIVGYGYLRLRVKVENAMTLGLGIDDTNTEAILDRFWLVTKDGELVATGSTYNGVDAPAGFDGYLYASLTHWTFQGGAQGTRDKDSSDPVANPNNESVILDPTAVRRGNQVWSGTGAVYFGELALVNGGVQELIPNKPGDHMNFVVLSGLNSLNDLSNVTFPYTSEPDITLALEENGANNKEYHFEFNETNYAIFKFDNMGQPQTMAAMDPNAPAWGFYVRLGDDYDVAVWQIMAPEGQNLMKDGWKLFDLDGNEVEFAGENNLIPAGFEGYVYIPGNGDLGLGFDLGSVIGWLNAEEGAEIYMDNFGYFTAEPTVAQNEPEPTPTPEPQQGGDQGGDQGGNDNPSNGAISLIGFAVAAVVAGAVIVRKKHN